MHFHNCEVFEMQLNFKKCVDTTIFAFVNCSNLN